MDFRIFVEKKSMFNVEAVSLKNDLNFNLGLSIKSLRLLNVYDLFNFSKELLEKKMDNKFEFIAEHKTHDEHWKHYIYQKSFKQNCGNKKTE